MYSDGTTTRIQIIFSGRVQGVGFRYTVCRIAETIHVAGFVRNLPDGNVEVVAEGDKQELLGFYNEIRNSTVGRYVLHDQIKWMTASGAFDLFRILYS